MIVHFAPYIAVKYVGIKSKELAVSIARPKPTLKKGDIVIVDKRQGHNLVNKGFGEFKEVKEISFLKAETEASERLEELEEKYSRALVTIAALEEELEEYKEVENDKETTTKSMQKKSISQVDDKVTTSEDVSSEYNGK